jgi:two-component system, sensor histidine kinase and response regulator
MGGMIHEILDCSVRCQADVTVQLAPDMNSRPDIADHPARILIVDDEREGREILEIMLSPEGFVLEAAASGAEALAMVARQSPDLILLDVMMPGMNGYEVVASIKAGPATKNIPVIVITALTDRDARMLGLSAGAEDVLTKPVDRAELCARVRNLLRLKAYGDYHDRYSHMLEGEAGARTADLQHERDRAQRYLDTATVMLVALDTDGRITLANRFACTMLGWTEDELLGRDWFDACLVARARGHVRERFDRLLLGDLSIAENTIRTRSGDERLIEWRSTVLRDDAGHVTGTLSSGTDVTERHQAVEALRAAKDAAEAANRAKSEFLANMSHEIRTPMNGVLGMIDLVLDTELTTDQRENLLIVQSSADALLMVINDIMDFSRMEAGQLDLDVIDFSVRDTIGDTSKAVAVKARLKGLALSVDIEETVPDMLRGDPGRLRQILVNLLGNAIKFTHRGKVALRVTPEAATSPDVVLHFSIRDTGVGIPLNRQECVFEAFTQADGSMTRAYGGTGLGLTISSQLIRLMGGRVWVESEVGKGSTFHFTARFADINAAIAAVPGAISL